MLYCPKCNTPNSINMIRCKNCNALLNPDPAQQDEEQAPQEEQVLKHDEVLQNKYKVIKKLGEGMFGTSYLVENINTTKQYVLRIYFKTSTTIWKLIQQEANILHKIDIKGIPKLVDSFAHEKRLCMVEEYVPGRTLREILTDKIKLTEEEGLLLLKKLLNITHQFHIHELIHRDIRPENIIINQNQKTNELGEVFLIDPGKIKETLLRIKIKKPRKEPTFKGYVPPEKSQGETGYGTDIYAIGMTLAESLTNKLALRLRTGENDIDINLENKKLEKILIKMTKYNKTERYQRIQDVINALEETSPEVPPIPVEPSVSVSEVTASGIEVSAADIPVSESETEPARLEKTIEEEQPAPESRLVEEKVQEPEPPTEAVKETSPTLGEEETPPEVFKKLTAPIKEPVEKISEQLQQSHGAPPSPKGPEEKKKNSLLWIILIIIGIFIITAVLFFILQKVPEKPKELTIITNPEKASIYTNNVLTGESPLTLILDAKKTNISIKAVKKNYASVVEKIIFTEGEEKKSIKLKLVKKIRSVGGIAFAYIKGGSFIMGSNRGDSDERPRHKVTISDFWMSRYEITQQQYKNIMGSNPSMFKGNRRPVDSVNWEQAVRFCKKFARRYKVKARLPYEAEWEYACRAGTTTSYYWGNTINGAYCWYSANSGSETHPVGKKKPNKWGLYDMLGNVDEWVFDYYDAGYYRSSPIKNPKGPARGYQWKVLRGGSWAYEPKFLRSADRYKFNLQEKLQFNGFRIVIKD